MSIIKSHLGNTQEFYGCAMRHYEELEPPFGYYVDFEIVPAATLAPFMEGDRSLLDSNGDKALMAALRPFYEYGPDSIEFDRAKLDFVAGTGYNFLTCYFDNFDYANCVHGVWYKIILNNESGKYACSIRMPDKLPIPADPVPPLMVGKCNIHSISQQQQETLLKTYRLVEVTGATAHNDSFGAIVAGTQVTAARVYYVGAALCVGLVGVALPMPTPMPVPPPPNPPVLGFFDFGYASGVNSKSTVVQGKKDTAASSLSSISANIIAYPNQTIVISHWHEDHCNLAAIFNPADANYLPFWRNAHWYVPQSNSPAALAINQRVNRAVNTPPGGSGGFHPSANAATAPAIAPAAAGPAIAPLNGNLNVQLGKIDALSNTHPHHHGQYLCVSLVSGKKAFLAGDCTYEGVNATARNNNGLGYDYLQACHHGGNYAYSPASQSTRETFIPSPKVATAGSPGGGTVVYSANGHTHGHPKSTYVNEHTRKNWNNSTITVTARAATPYYDMT